MSDIQLKLNGHAKKIQPMKKKLTEKVPELTPIIELVDKDIKIAAVNCSPCVQKAR